MTDCPITLKEILAALTDGKFIKMDEVDLEGFAGLEGVGYNWSLDDRDAFVVLDRTDERLHFEVTVIPEEEKDYNVWGITLGVTDFVQIC